MDSLVELELEHCHVTLISLGARHHHPHLHAVLLDALVCYEVTTYAFAYDHDKSSVFQFQEFSQYFQLLCSACLTLHEKFELKDYNNGRTGDIPFSEGFVRVSDFVRIFLTVAADFENFVRFWTRTAKCEHR